MATRGFAECSCERPRRVAQNWCAGASWENVGRVRSGA